MRIGAQLYTIREFTQTIPDIERSFKRIADIGYTCVQVSAIGKIGAEQLRDIAKFNNLDIIVTHTSADRIRNDIDNVIAEHKIFGCDCVGVGALPVEYQTGLDGYRQFIADFTLSSKKLAENGMQFYYHNHDFEFVRMDNSTPYDVMVKETIANKWNFLLDTYWIQYAGRCPARQLEKLKGRTNIIHLKDMAIRDHKQIMAPIFEGNIDFPEIFEVCKALDIKYAMVEQDDCYGECPFDQLAVSFNNLRARGLC